MIKVLLFAHLQEKIGKESLSLDIPSISVKELKELIGARFELGALEHVMIAVNEEYALDEDLVQSDDVVALIPPVSGG
ncbi:molybdenum cofactor biosynthesis protein MoaD [Bacillus sp. SA1-12]|uniref:molybdopterin converting factor subunit 1 n=1 Tax=Bacillus sp. SA1-12 TaxID=1455638 RepID=UPI000625D236|nr:molybdopterin converting factor subunit 1 [Bacillus sp. SA1-12]KKI93851.1 molybdenum cofactor biosynthesis protein MoaD [Bacillus sp. SA1-12]